MKRTATFLPKPIVGINGSGMHTNISLFSDGKNLFYDEKGQYGMSQLAWKFINRLLNHANEICLILNSSVNAYRRLDPNFEAPNKIRVSPADRGVMIRLPIGNVRSARIEIRSVAPDANPYLVAYTTLEVGLSGKELHETGKRPRVRFLAGTINEALRQFKSSDLMTRILGHEPKDKYAYYKELAAERSPSVLGNRIKNGEVLYHHEVTNQVIWNNF
jgi:glutamine synthetase